MKKEQITAQMYTVRNYLTNLKDVEIAAQRLSNIGFKSVQLSAWNKELDLKEIKKIFDDNGLVCDSTHPDANKILNDPMGIVKELNDLGAKYTAYPFPAEIKLFTKNQCMDFINKLNEAGKVLYENGKVLTYHNHHYEFTKQEGEILLDMIYNYTDPNYVQGEIDTYWIQKGGQSIETWIKKLNNRLPLFHMKDYGVKFRGDDNLDCGFTCEVGQGNIDWPLVAKLAEEAGAKWFIIEQDCCDGDQFDSLKLSYDYIANNLCED